MGETKGRYLKPERIVRSCPICGPSETRIWLRPSHSPGPVVRCQGCGFAFVTPVISSKSIIFEGPELGDYPESHLRSNDLSLIEGSWEKSIITPYLAEIPAKKANARKYLDEIALIVQQPGRLMDFGCFCGVFLSEAKNLGWDCYGLEPLVMPAVYARGSFGLKVITDTLHDGIYPTDFFDVVTSFQVFEHLVQPEADLRILSRSLKKGGLLLIEVPNIDCLIGKLMGAKNRHFVADHLSFFCEKTLSHLLENAGFKIAKIKYPTRKMSMVHLINWLYKFIPGINSSKKIPPPFLKLNISINLQDILAIFAIKAHHV